MHKKIHQNIIFSIHRVKRNRLETLNALTGGGQLNAKSTVTLAFHNEASPPKVLLPKQDRRIDDIGEDTDHELSLSREDDSDMSVISEPYEEKKNVPEQVNKRLADIHISEPADNSDSESLEDSVIDEQSEYDEAAQEREERTKLVKIFEKREIRTSCVSGSKVKLPYEMLINKLVDSLDTPEMVRHKELPVPTGMQNMESSMFIPNKTAAVKEEKSNKGLFATSYSRLATGISEPGEAEPLKKQAAPAPYQN
jgi:hypothetical protein